MAPVAGRRQQSSQYPNSTPDAWTPFFLSTWIRNTAKLCWRVMTLKVGAGEQEECGGRREPHTAPPPPPGQEKQQPRVGDEGVGQDSVTMVVSHTVG